MCLDSPLHARGSASCRPCGKSKVDTDDWKNAVDMVKLAVRIAKIQMAKSRFFHFEHPMGASSWNVTELSDLKMFKDVETVLLRLCACNLTARDGFGEGLMLMPTRTLTNMSCLAERLCKRCSREHSMCT